MYLQNMYHEFSFQTDYGKHENKIEKKKFVFDILTFFIFLGPEDVAAAIQIRWN